MNRKEIFRLSSFVFLDCTETGFVLPLFKLSGATNEYFIQVPNEITKTISHFERMSLEEAAPPLASQCSAVTGGPIVYAFKCSNGQFLTGTLGQIGDQLKSLAAGDTLPSGVKLQIYELVGDLSSKRDARRIMKREIAMAHGLEAATDFFVYSVLRSLLWERLLESAPDQAAASRILSNRRALRVFANGNGQVGIDIDVLDTKDFCRTTEEALLAELQEEYDSANEYHEVDLRIVATNADEDHSELLKKLISFPRQEERVAFFLRQILDEKITPALLNAYKDDRATFAKTALNLIRSSVRADMTAGEREIRIAKILKLMYGYAIGFNRGRLLLHLAEHLAGYQNINKEIKRLTEKSNNSYVIWLKEDILALLNKKSEI